MPPVGTAHRSRDRQPRARAPAGRIPRRGGRSRSRCSRAGTARPSRPRARRRTPATIMPDPPLRGAARPVAAAGADRGATHARRPGSGPCRGVARTTAPSSRPRGWTRTQRRGRRRSPAPSRTGRPGRGARAVITTSAIAGGTAGATSRQRARRLVHPPGADCERTAGRVVRELSGQRLVEHDGQAVLVRGRAHRWPPLREGVPGLLRATRRPVSRRTRPPGSGS